MRYGLTSNDIVASFTGAISGDFASWIYSGSEIIEREIDLQSAKLDTIIPKFVKKTFKEVKAEILEPDSSYIVTPGLPVDSIKSFKLYNRASCPDKEKECFSIDTSLSYTDNGDGTYTLTTQNEVIANYTVDQTTLEDSSMKALLRDMTCCSLGRKLFPSGTEVWNIVEYYCQSATEQIEMIKKDKNWLPSSMADMDFQRTGLNTLYILRG